MSRKTTRFLEEWKARQAAEQAAAESNPRVVNLARTDMVVEFSVHARQRIQQMGITEGQVIRAFRAPEMDYRAPRRHGDGTRIATSGDVAVCYRQIAPATVLVITALWNGKVFVREDASPDKAAEIEAVQHEAWRK